MRVKAGVGWEESVDPPKPRRPTPEEIAAAFEAECEAAPTTIQPRADGTGTDGYRQRGGRGWTAEQATAFEEQMVAHKYSLLAVSRMGRKKPPKTKCGRRRMLQEGNGSGQDKENDKAGDNRARDDEKNDRADANAAKDETGEPNGGGDRLPVTERRRGGCAVSQVR